nr:CREB-regulated transcription coactivator 1-like [Leptinotarsa decemlineata]
MANPRKFSEKIARHNQRQAEETAAFEEIMKEVIQVRSKVVPDSEKNTLHINTQALGAFRGGSLPNVSTGHPSVKCPQQNCGSAKDEASLSNKVISFRVEGRSRTRSQSGPMRRHHDRKTDTSPYGAFLSPIVDTGWGRTKSDSALHQSAMQGMVDRNADPSHRAWNMSMVNGPDRGQEGRPRSSCDIPSRVPGISIHPSAHDPSLVQIPIANNTGSLPDLTNVDFSSPIHAPLDQDHDSSPYSSSPVNTSPSTLSPTSIHPGVRPAGRVPFSPVFHTHSNQLTVPFSARYHQHQEDTNKNIQLDKNVINMVDSSNFQQLHGWYHQGPPTSTSPTLQQTADYRSPRPSPQSSPSPGGRHSAPCSPGAPSPLPNEFHIPQFGQLSMMDPPNNVMFDQTSTGQQMAQSLPQQTMGDATCVANIDMIPDAGYYSTSPQLVYPSASPGQHATPNTSPGLPEIILTDFSGDDGSRQLVSELFSEESLKEGLGSLDLEAFQLLTNSSMGISENIEDNFRLDHRS